MADYPTPSPTEQSSVQSNLQTTATGTQAARVRVRTAGQFQDQLSEEYTIETPENVSFGYEVAGIGSRFIAALIDHIILGVLLAGLYIALIAAIGALAGDSSVLEPEVAVESSADDWVAGFIMAIFALLNFAIWWGYYMLFEWLWNGQTIGKRSTKIRVVRADGAPITFVPVAVRNLVRVVDFLPFGYGVGVITMFCNRQSRRLGDFAAGTLVVIDQGELKLQSLLASIPNAAANPLRTDLPQPSHATNAPELSPEQDWSGIRRLSAGDYALVQETLARHRSGNLDNALLRRVATAIATKLEGNTSYPLDDATAEATDLAASSRNKSVAEQVVFLEAVAAAYGRWVR